MKYVVYSVCMMLFLPLEASSSSSSGVSLASIMQSEKNLALKTISTNKVTEVVANLIGKEIMSFVGIESLDNVTTLFLDSNNLTRIDIPEKAKLPLIKMLSLGHNPLKKMNVVLHTHFPNLEDIDMSNCQLEFICQNGFSDLANLIAIDLSNNPNLQIQELQQRLFLGSNKLKEIILKNTAILSADITEDVIAKLGIPNNTKIVFENDSIQVVDGKPNRIAPISKWGIISISAALKSAHYKKDEWRDKESVRIEYDFSNAGITDLSGIETLDKGTTSLMLNNNLLNYTIRIQHSLSHLRILSLMNNPVQFIQEHMFWDGKTVYLNELREINLANCDITVIDEKAFLGLPKLESIILTGNKNLQYSSLVPRTFAHLPALKVIDFSETGVSGEQINEQAISTLGLAKGVRLIFSKGAERITYRIEDGSLERLSPLPKGEHMHKPKADVKERSKSPLPGRLSPRKELKRVKSSPTLGIQGEEKGEDTPLDE